MAAVVARLEKRSAEAETPTETFELECEHAHKSHRQSRSSGQSNRQRPRQRGHGFQAPQQRQRKDGGVTAYAAEGYQLHRFPQQTQSFQAQAQHMRDYHEDPTCPQCQRRHLDACQRVIGVCSTCEEVGHHTAICSSWPQQQHHQHQQQQQQYRPLQQQKHGGPQQQQRGMSTLSQWSLQEPLAQPQWHWGRGDQQLRAQQGQQGQQDQRG